MRDYSYDGRPIRSLTPEQLREVEDLLNGRVEGHGLADTASGEPLSSADLARARERVELERRIRLLLGEPQ